MSYEFYNMFPYNAGIILANLPTLRRNYKVRVLEGPDVLSYQMSMNAAHLHGGLSRMVIQMLKPGGRKLGCTAGSGWTACC